MPKDKNIIDALYAWIGKDGTNEEGIAVAELDGKQFPLVGSIKKTMEAFEKSFPKERAGIFKLVEFRRVMKEVDTH